MLADTYTWFHLAYMQATPVSVHNVVLLFHSLHTTRNVVYKVFIHHFVVVARLASFVMYSDVSAVLISNLLSALVPHYVFG